MASPSTSETSICNLALDNLGQAPVNDINDVTVVDSRRCLRWYAQTRDEVLRSIYWNFAETRASLGNNGQTPNHEWTYEAVLPNDYIRLRKFEGEPAERASERYNIERDKKLLSENKDPDIVYTARITDVSQFDPLFINALAEKLAANMARLITGSTTLKKEFMESYNVALWDAAKADAAEDKHQQRGIPGAVADSLLVTRRRTSNIG